MPEVGLVAADGKSAVRDLTQSGYEDVLPKWAMDGKMMIWGSTRDGALAQGGGSVSGDIYGMYFSKALYDRSKLTKEENALQKEQEDKGPDVPEQDVNSVFKRADELCRECAETAPGQRNPARGLAGVRGCLFF